MRVRPSRGFTLVELLIVVAMVGVLAALAVVGYRQYLNVAHSGEAKMVLQGIRGAQEVYKAETLVYLSCSGTYLDWYPQNGAAPSDKKHHFVQPGHSDFACWQMLNVSTDGPVRFGYAVRAGAAAEAIPAMGGEWATPPVWPVPTVPWYVIQATGDADGDSTYSLFVTSSFSGDIYAENETE